MKRKIEWITVIIQVLIFIVLLIGICSCNKQQPIESPKLNADSIVKYETNKRIDKTMDSLKWYKDSLELDLLKFRCKKAGL